MDFCGEFTRSELHTKTHPVNPAAFDVDTHALYMREDTDSHVQFFLARFSLQ